MSEAQRRALALTDRMNEVAHVGRRPPSGLSLLGIGQEDVMGRLEALEERTRRTVWNSIPSLVFDPEDVSYRLDDRSAKRGVDVQTVTLPRALRFNPLLTSLNPRVEIGPVLLKSIIVDEALAVIAGPDTVDGATTAWLATDGPFLEDAIAVWHATMAESRPALAPGDVPPLNERQLEVGRAVCLGRTDAVIARQLEVSQRTVARDVAAILEVTQAGSRAEAVLNMLGRGRQSRT